MQLEITMEQFKEGVEDWLFNVADHGDVLKVDTEHGKAVIISEEEWLTLRNEFFELKRKNK